MFYIQAIGRHFLQEDLPGSENGLLYSSLSNKLNPHLPSDPAPDETQVIRYYSTLFDQLIKRNSLKSQKMK
jgi:hypothetical protein